MFSCKELTFNSSVIKSNEMKEGHWVRVCVRERERVCVREGECVYVRESKTVLVWLREEANKKCQPTWLNDGSKLDEVT